MMSRFTLTAAVGLAAASAADADVMFTFAGPATLAAGESVVLFSGNLSGTATTFDWSFVYGELVSDASWASDMQIVIEAANGNSVAIGGFANPGPLLPSYNGSGSTAPGTYAQAAPLNLGAFNLSGSGLWTVTMINDWINAPSSDPNPNTIAEFEGVIGGVVPTPGALSLFAVAGLAAARRRR